MILKLKDNQRKEMNILKLCQILQWVKRKKKVMTRKMFPKKFDKLTAELVKLTEMRIKYFNNQEDCEKW
jgi:hypothetical protein